MADVSTFGVDLDVVRQFMPGLPATLSSTTYPTEDQLTAIIARKATLWCARLTQVGVSATEIALDPDSQAYGIMQECIACDVSLQLAVSRERVSTDLLDRLKEQRDASWALMVEQPGALGDGQNREVGTVASHVTDAAAVRRAVQGQSLAARLANAGVL